MPNPSRRPQGTSRNTYEFTPEERAAFGGGWPMPRYISGGVSDSQFNDQLHAFLQQAHSPVPPLPHPTDDPRRVIDAAVRSAVVDLQRTCHLHTRYQMMPDLYASPDRITEMHRQMQQTVLREMSDQLKKKIRFTVIPTIQDYGKTVEAEVVIMSPVELQAFGESVARQVIDACVKQGYFR